MPDPGVSTTRSRTLSSTQVASDGSFGKFDVDYMAHAIRDLIDGAAYYLPDHPGMDGERFINEGMGLLLRAIGASPSSETRGAADANTSRLVAQDEEL